MYSTVSKVTSISGNVSKYIPVKQMRQNVEKTW